MLATVAATDSAKVQKKSTAFLYIAKQNHTLCTLYIKILWCEEVIYGILTMSGKTIDIDLIVLMTQRQIRQRPWIAVKRWTRRVGTWRRNM